MACSKTVDKEIDLDEKPTLLPLISKYLVISWITLVEWDLDSKMDNFKVAECKVEGVKKKWVVLDPKIEGMKLSHFDDFIIENLIHQGARVWIKCISDLEDIEINEGCLMRGQRCFACIQLSNKMIEHKVINYLGHQRYTVHIKKSFPW